MDDPVWVRRARGFLDFFSTLNLSILLNHRCWKGNKEEKRKLDKGHLKVIRDKFWEIRLLVRWKKRFQVSVHSCNTDGDAVKQQVDVEILFRSHADAAVLMQRRTEQTSALCASSVIIQTPVESWNFFNAFIVQLRYVSSDLKPRPSVWESSDKKTLHAELQADFQEVDSPEMKPAPRWEAAELLPVFLLAPSLWRLQAVRTPRIFSSDYNRVYLPSSQLIHLPASCSARYSRSASVALSTNNRAETETSEEQAENRDASWWWWWNVEGEVIHRITQEGSDTWCSTGCWLGSVPLRPLINNSTRSADKTTTKSKTHKSLSNLDD